MSTEDFKQMVTPCADPYPVDPTPAPVPTPRTDEEVSHIRVDCDDSCCVVYFYRDGKEFDGDIVPADFARTLERELRAEVERLIHDKGATNGRLQTQYWEIQQLRAAIDAAEEALRRADAYMRGFTQHDARLPDAPTAVKQALAAIKAVNRSGLKSENLTNEVKP